MGRVRRAVVLLSGGLDSATCLWWARARGYRMTALSVLYGQRHARELHSAAALARRAGAAHRILRLELPWLKASSLVDRGRRLPDLPPEAIGRGAIPSTYVPARNTVLLALAASLADAERAGAIVVGQNCLDCSGYPDCRPAYNRAVERALRLGTRSGVEGRPIRILAPLIRLDKAAIVRLALRLRVPLERTWSCYAGGRRPCGRCDSCKLRARGFAQVGARDPAL